MNSDYRFKSDEDIFNILNIAEPSVCMDSFDSVVSNLTPSKRNLVLAGVELYKRCSSHKKERKAIRSSVDIYDIMAPFLEDNRTEEFWCIYLNRNLKVIRKARLSSGGYGQCDADVKLIMKEALLSEATAFAVCHNHPSGNATPSYSDNKLTKAVLTTLTLNGITMLDHIIISNNDYYSFNKSGLISKYLSEVKALLSSPIAMQKPCKYNN